MRNEWVIIVLTIILLGSFAVQTVLVLLLMRHDRWLTQPIVHSAECDHEEDQ